MTRAWRILIAAGTIFGCVIAAPLMVGAERLAASVGDYVTGYQVTVRGKSDIQFNASIAAPIRLVVEDAVFSIPESHFIPVDNPPVLQIARIETNINPWLLLTGRIGFSQLSLVRPGFHFHRTSGGIANWTVADKSKLGPVQSRETAFWRKMKVASFNVSDGSVRYTDERLTRDLSFDGVNFDVGISESAEGMVFRLRGDARHLGEPIYIESEIQRLDEFLAGTRAPFVLLAEAQPGRLLIKGDAAVRHRPAFNADIQIDIDDPAALIRLLPFIPADIADTAALRCSVEFQGDRLKSDVRSLIYRRTDLTGTLSFDTSATDPRLDIELSAGAFDLSHIRTIGVAAGLIGAHKSPTKRKYITSGGARFTWNRLVTDDGDLGSGGAGVSWRTGTPNLAIEVSNMSAFDGTLGGRAEITANEGKTAILLTITGSDLEAAKVFNFATGSSGVAGRLHGKAEFLAVGSTPAELLKAAGGSGRISVTEGRVFGSRFQKAIDMNRRNLQLAWASMNFTVDAGTLHSDDLIMDFDVGHSKAKVDWNLAGGATRIQFGGSPLHERARGPVEISGTLSEILRAK